MKRLSLIMLAAALTACANQTPSQLATDAATLAAGLAGLAQVLNQNKVLGASTLQMIQTDAILAQQAALGVAQATASTDTKPLVDKIIIAANDVVSRLTSSSVFDNLPKTVQIGLEAAETLIPVVEAEAGLPVQSGMGMGSMTPDEARRILEVDSRL